MGVSFKCTPTKEGTLRGGTAQGSEGSQVAEALAAAQGQPLLGLPASVGH